MSNYKVLSACGLAVASLVASSSQAAVLAFTDFDSSTASGNTKSNLNWALNGLEDPGDMSAFVVGGGAQNLFDGNAFVQENFTPGLNVGNTDSSWTTDIAITVASGFTVTLTDVTLNSVSVNGGQAENVNRRNDYTVTIFNPSAVQVATVNVSDTIAGTTGGGQPLVTLDFADVVLTDPGTYTLQIRGGDFSGTGETGNHTGIDNLSINGTVVPEPSSLALLALGGLAMIRRRRA